MKGIPDVDDEWIDEMYNKISIIRGLTYKARSNFDRSRITLSDKSCTPHYIEKLVRLTNEEYYKQQYLPTKIKEQSVKDDDDIKSSVKSHVSSYNEEDKIDISKIVENKIDLSEKFQLTDIQDKIYQEEYQCVEDIISDMSKIMRQIHLDSDTFLFKQFDNLEKKFSIVWKSSTNVQDLLHKIPAHFNRKKSKTLWQLVLACNKVIVVNEVDFRHSSVGDISDDPQVFSMFQG
ncbi:MAG: hypothetical protein EZS28_046374 [Streblomastix strix]|uniref:Uncharacterized protein n=1 Tax=Streblomastix strix TaxID=222440 RepID=A0A5J4TIW7_9EUKA|nr:MAG: hypothetical protein EZS28_046374 [Streblomastix strix]